jgi:hypothetical protein
MHGAVMQVKLPLLLVQHSVSVDASGELDDMTCQAFLCIDAAIAVRITVAMKNQSCLGCFDISNTLHMNGLSALQA